MKRRIDVLDGLRGLAVLIVFLSHTSGRGQSITPFLKFNGIGHIGVYLFFTLSAFLLSIGILSKPFSFNGVKAFFIKRLLRIAPLYYLVVSGVFFIQIIYDSYSPKYLHVSNGFKGYFEHLYFIRGDGIFWSIVSEIQFYFIVPIIGWFLIRFKQRAVFVLLLMAFLNFVLYLLRHANIIDYLYYFSPNTLQRGTFIDVFIPGLIAAYLVQFKKEFLKKNKALIHLIANFLLFFGGLLTLVLVSENFLGFNRPFYHFRFLSLLFAISFSLIIISLYMNNNFLNLLFKNSLLQLIGKIGFSFYLIHMAVLEIVNKVSLHNSLKFFISFTLLVIFSFISYNIIEKPSIRLSYRILKKLKLERY